MGAESCSPVSDFSNGFIGCVKKDDESADDAKAKEDFQTLQEAKWRSNGIKSEHYLKDLSKENSKAITCAHLIGSIIKHYFESDDNKCDQIGKFTQKPGIDTTAILDNILIIGSGPRNYLLKRTINSIDFAINTRELTKIMLQHLRNYHNTEKSQSSSKCILWRIYLNKFLNNNNYDDKEKRKYEFIADCDYLLNAYFMVDYILKKHISSPLRDKLSIHRDEITKIYHCEIIDEILFPKYESYDLDGSKFSIFDITDKMVVYKQLFGTISTEQRLERTQNIHSKHRIKLAEIKRASTMSSVPIAPITPITPNTPNSGYDDDKPYGRISNHHPTPSDSVSLSFSLGGSEFRSPMNGTNLQRFDSIPAFQFRLNDKPIDTSTKSVKNKHKNKSKTIPIELPFYQVRFAEIIKLMDFSINTLTIKLSDVLEINHKLNITKKTKMKKDYSFENLEDEYADDFDEDNINNNSSVYNDDVMINYDWTKKLINGLDGYNALQDYKKKLITHPYPQNAIKCHGPDIYFWKIIRFGVMLNSWTIDKKIISITKDNYHLWLNDLNYWNKENKWNKNKKLLNYQVFVDMMFKQNICFNNSIKQYIRMISIFSKLDIHSKLISIMNKNVKFKNCFVKTLNNLKINNKKDIIQLFSSKGYIVK